MLSTVLRRAPHQWLMLLTMCLWNPLSVTDAADSTPSMNSQSTDALFKDAYVDVDEWRQSPARHRYVHGGFRGTQTKFSIYLPPKAAYDGRFFQYITPVPDSETLSQGATGEEDRIGFALASGAYFVESNGGGADATGMPGPNGDRTIGAYRANAAVAQYSRVIAQQMYGGKRPYGYAFGGSGGAYRTIGGIENTTGVWDGVVPYVVGSPMAIPNVFSVRMHAMRILKNRFPQIVDALDAGGNGDMYVGLNQEQADALREVTRMGFPPQSWFAYRTMGVHAFAVLYPGIVQADPQYFSDFWSAPGYLGTRRPESLMNARLQFKSTIRTVLNAEQARARGVSIETLPGQRRGTADAAWQALQLNAVAFQLAATPPAVEFLGGDLLVLTGKAAGRTLPLRQVIKDVVVPGVIDTATLALLRDGDEVQIDNSNFLAAQTYHRHQVPGNDYPVWDQFRTSEGRPMYPQRPMLLGPLFAAGAAGTVQSGRFEGRMILVESLWDREAYPWQADWYARKVREHLGADTDQRFRVWMVDRALHSDTSAQEDPTRTVSYLGVLHQALRDLATWVEQGKAPPASTSYAVLDGQVTLPAHASKRRGVQPVVTLVANGNARVEIEAGASVTLKGIVEVPNGDDDLVAADWNVDGSSAFQSHAAPQKTGDTTWTLTHVQRFNTPGTHFVTLRVASRRKGSAGSDFAKLQNLTRARVVVRERR